MSSSRKRKHRTDTRLPHETKNYVYQERERSPDVALFIQAYEADIIRGPSARIATSLEVFDYESMSSSSTKPPPKSIGDALIKWGGSQLTAPQPAFPGDEDNDAVVPKIEDNSNSIWVDRYDARLLLDSLPVNMQCTSHTATPDSPGGWSDLPSDTEDTFFFSPKEAEDFRRDKRRRLLDRTREERLKARRIEDGDVSEEEDEPWGGSDEEPEEAQKELMRRTATHLLSSPNPAQLEMRILANHGSDKRFAFLRGRWGRAWKILKGKAKMEKEAEGRKKAETKGLGALAGYSDSDDDNEGSDGGENKKIEPVEVGRKGDETISPTIISATQEVRRARAKEWAEKRRNLKNEGAS